MVQAMALKDFLKSPPIPSITAANNAAEAAQSEHTLLEQSSEQFVTLPDDHQAFLRTEGFTREYEQQIRTITNPDGTGNAAYDMDKERAMKPQDQLTRVWGWFHGTTAFSCMFRWASGRQDAYIVMDNPSASEDVIEAHKAQRIAFRNHFTTAQETN